MKWHSSAESAMLANTPLPLAAMPMRWLVRRSVVAAKSSTALPRSEARKRRCTRRTGRVSKSDSQSGAITVTRAGFQQASGFSESDFTGAHHQHRAILQVEKDRVMFQSQ